MLSRKPATGPAPSTASGRSTTTGARARRIDRNRAAERIDAPGKADAIRDPLLHLGVQLRQGVRGRENLDEEIRCEGKEPLPFLLAQGFQAARFNPARIGTERGTVGQVEAGIRAEGLAPSVRFSPGKKFMHNIGFAAVVLKAARSHHKNLS
ncbi:MAG: hypothetical protein ABSG51_00350 [Terracidiphilus sp.]